MVSHRKGERDEEGRKRLTLDKKQKIWWMREKQLKILRAKEIIVWHHFCAITLDPNKKKRRQWNIQKRSKKKQTKKKKERRRREIKSYDNRSKTYKRQHLSYKKNRWWNNISTPFIVNPMEGHPLSFHSIHHKRQSLERRAREEKKTKSNKI